MPQLEFSHVYFYASWTQGISLPVTLGSGAETSRLRALVDTGASNCLFERALGETLGLDIEAGDPRTFPRQPPLSRRSDTWSPWRS
jgi:hypothetical protein